jgi:hypothetical protein
VRYGKCRHKSRVQKALRRAAAHRNSLRQENVLETRFVSDHFRAVGFVASSDKALRALIERALRDGQEATHAGGAYVFWELDCGAGICLALNADDDVIAVTPYLDAASIFTTQLFASVRGAAVSESGLEGTLTLAAEGLGAEVAVDVLNWAKSPWVRGVFQGVSQGPFTGGVVVFAHEARILDEAAPQPADGAALLAPDSELPWAGRVEQARYVRNEASNERFWVAEVSGAFGGFTLVGWPLPVVPTPGQRIAVAGYALTQAAMQDGQDENDQMPTQDGSPS